MQLCHINTLFVLHVHAGQVIKPVPSLWASFTDQLKKIYLAKVRGGPPDNPIVCEQFVSSLQFKGIDLKEMAACTLLFEGTAEVNKFICRVNPCQIN